MPTSLIYRLRGEDPQSKVGELIRKYRSADNSSLAMIFNNLDSYGVLINALRRQINLVKCRSHEFEDCQITVYDKALLILSNYGDCVTDPGVLGLYLTEFLGVVPIAPNSDGNEAVASHVELESILERLRATQEKNEATCHIKEDQCDQIVTPAYKSNNSNDEYNPYFPKIHRAEEDEIKYSAAPDKEGRSSVRVARLLDVYHQAKEDYFKIRARDGVESLPAVKFLRDSAENTLRYLHSNGLSDHVWVRDLEETFAISRDKTAQLLGGRKRHFDEDHKRHYSEDYKGKQRGYKRARRVVDSYRPKCH